MRKRSMNTAMHTFQAPDYRCIIESLERAHGGVPETLTVRGFMSLCVVINFMPSKFDKKVYQAVSMVPIGMVTTYKLLAAAINCRSSQAVGQALRRNPYAYDHGRTTAPRVPCHRVIKSDLSLGGFMGELGGAPLLKKIALLQDEGVIFKDGRLLDSSKLFDFPDDHS